MAIITTKYTGKMLFAAVAKLPSSGEDFKITNTILIIVTKIINSAFFIFFSKIVIYINCINKYKAILQKLTSHSYLPAFK